MQEKRTYSTGKKMQSAREEADFGVSEMAKLLEISRQTYSYLENGQVSPRFELLERFATVTGKPVHYFCNESSNNLRHDQKLINTGRNQGIIFASRQLAELFNQVGLAKQLIETIGVSIDTGREKDSVKLKELMSNQK